MRRRDLALVFSFVALLSGCEPATHDDTTPTTTQKQRPRISREAAPLPERFNAALPASVAEFTAWIDDDPRFPPQTLVVDALVAGDAPMLDRLAAAAQRVGAEDASAYARLWYDRLAWYDPAPAFCAAAHDVLTAPASTLRMILAGSWARHCADGNAGDLVLRADTPDWAVLAWYRDSAVAESDAPPAYDVRLADILRNALLRRQAQDARDAASTLSRHPDPAAAKAAIELLTAAAHRQIADSAAVAMLGSQNAQVRAYAVAACERQGTSADRCRRVWVPPPSPPAEEKGPTASEITELALKLRAIGFDRIDPADMADTGNVESMLLKSGHALWFDVETGTFPNNHDSLLRELAALIKPSLDGVSFEELPPTIDDGSGVYRLRAYVDGQRLEIEAEDLGDWYDVDAVLRLLDAVLLERKARERYVLLETRDQTAIIVAARAEVLEAALDAGLIRSDNPDAARTLGKAFEERVLRSLQQGVTASPSTAPQP
jgi:hypothetical protein